MSDSAYDVFVSYRRESGGQTARLVRDALQVRGWRVFLDVEDLDRGYFDEALLKTIAATRNFVLILSAGCLERCVHENDWLRKEIVHALTTGRNIVPVLLPEFKFPPEIDPSVQEIQRWQGVSYNHEWFDAMVEKLAKALIAASTGNPLSKAVLPAAVESKARVLEAAAPKQTSVGRSTEVVTMVRCLESGGLRAYLDAEELPSLSRKDVKERSFELEFPLDKRGHALPAEISLRLESPDFDPPVQTKKLRVPVARDSEVYSFLIKPRIIGELVLILELLKQDEVIISRSIRTTAECEGVVVGQGRNLITIPFTVAVDPSQEDASHAGSLATPPDNLEVPHERQLSGNALTDAHLSPPVEPSASFEKSPEAQKQMSPMLVRAGLGAVVAAAGLAIGSSILMRPTQQQNDASLDTGSSTSTKQSAPPDTQAALAAPPHSASSSRVNADVMTLDLHAELKNAAPMADLELRHEEQSLGDTALQRISDSSVTVGKPTIRQVGGNASSKNGEWAYYLVCQPFTLHPLDGERLYESLSFQIFAEDQSITVVDAFPRSAMDRKATAKIRVISSEASGYKLIHASLGDAETAGSTALLPEIRFNGQEHGVFAWDYKGSMEHPLQPETEQAVLLLRVKKSMEHFEGKLKYKVVIAEKSFAGYRHREAASDEFPVSWSFR
jgi:hypothetical protein